jgi:hypothetical protein
VGSDCATFITSNPSILQQMFRTSTNPALLFFSYNPGINCDNLMDPSPGVNGPGSANTQVCIGTGPPGVTQCTSKNAVKITLGGSCEYILNRYFGKSFQQFSKLNPRVNCLKLNFDSFICVPLTLT